MAKKKEKKVFNIDEVNLEIDYDQLAAAIVKANEQQAEKYSVSSEWMKYLLYPVFICIIMASGITAAAFLYHAILDIENVFSLPADWNDIFSFIIVFCSGLFLMGVCAFSIFSLKEIEKEKDRQFVASMFSNIVALVALVISLIALVKG